MIDYTFYIVLFLFLGLILLGFWGWGKKTVEPKPTRYTRGGFGEQMEIDLRLTYKRFKELYPYSQITYQEYKKLQAQKAFKRAISSQKIKRMVR